MAPVIRRTMVVPQHLPAPAHQALAHLPGPLSSETALVHVGMHEVSHLAQYAAYKAALTLAIAQRLKKARAQTNSTPEQEAQFSQHVAAYLDEILSIVDGAGLKMRDILREARTVRPD